PNGDPMDENKPRMDENTDTLIVSDVRLKRTIRDYLKDYYNETLWVSGDAVTPESRKKELGIDSKEDAVKKCIDIRLFGAVIPSKGKGAVETSLTGPVQFRYGRSLHKVKWQFIQGTAAFLSREGTEQRSFREEYIVPYALIAFYGVINDKNAEITKLTENDVEKMLEAMWYGTKNLITRSKMEQNPRFLMKIDYKEGVKFHHGELDYLIFLTSDKDDYEIRDIIDFKIELAPLMNSLAKIKNKIEKINYKIDERLTLTQNGEIKLFEEIFSDFLTEELRLE
ncbi:MAG: type I-B CRISPR-associated protein Cas7/Csh2, partial [Thermotoga sp.]